LLRLSADAVVVIAAGLLFFHRLSLSFNLPIPSNSNEILTFYHAANIDKLSKAKRMKARKLESFLM